MNVGIIGLGYVGSACEELFKDYFTLNTFDINKDSNCESVSHLVEKSEIIFICLPTPMQKNGSCDLSIINSVLTEINNLNKQKFVVIKSTVKVGTTDIFSSTYKNLDFIFNPEFLTEANFIEDFKNQDRIIIGSHSEDASNALTNLYQMIYKDKNNVKIEKTTPINAELVKYVTNAFLSVKVSFANEIYSFAKEINANYNKVIELAMLDKRLGTTHWSVPGPDGKMGFGGSCFPKDINSLINSFRDNGIEPKVLEAAWLRNLTIDRPEKDWLELKGRAVSNEDSE
tara:strand:+ start:829 stop:1683 length:855 start_codon:yes stop_codon:yes gene_type:complete